MGIRIKKQIGYFLSKKELAFLFVSKYKKIIENLDADDKKEEEFFTSLISMMSEHKNKQGKEDVFVAFHLKDEYSKTFKDKTIRAYQLIGELMFCDTSKGVFICSIEQHEKSRYDDLIDYYENSMTENVKYINRPIYPMTGYVYQGGLTQYPNLMKGEILDGTQAWIAIKADSAKQKNDLQKHSNEVVKGGYFTPSIEPLIYMIAKSAKVLKEDVTKEQFEAVIKPVIATTWG